MNISGGKNEAKINGTLLSGFVISDKNGKALFRYQVNTFAAEKIGIRQLHVSDAEACGCHGGKGRMEAGERCSQCKEGGCCSSAPGHDTQFSKYPARHSDEMRSF